ncbi:GTPase Era [Alphaproteobacteria bacterium]|jgi:GTPase|nr:GTPase Era [Alphaproteobacteria bacterium]
MDNPETRCGFIAVIGAPNAGKSTLVNQIIGAKVSIVSPKVQTTRTRVTGILAEGTDQAIFVDTPGIFRGAKRRLEKAMVDVAWRQAAETDRLMLVIDVSRKRLSDDDHAVIEQLEQQKAKPILVLNKTDSARHEVMLEIATAVNARLDVQETFMVSALTGDGVEDLKNAVLARLPAGPWLYPDDQISDLPSRMLAAEATREKLFMQLHQELPYNLTVETELFEVQKNGDLKINQVIYVTRDSHKAMVLGKSGARIKQVGSQSRQDLAELFDRKVHLFLFVKVRENWLNDPERFREMGLELG